MQPRFLIVDDDPTIREMVAAMLQSFGCETDTAEGGTQALAKIALNQRTKPYDAVFLDIMMPDLDGLQVLKRIKGEELFADLPVIMLTAKDDGELMMQAYQDGAAYYIAKPFNSKQIVYCLDIILGEEEAAEIAKLG